MTINHLHYKLTDGFIHHWLIAGPLTRPLPERENEKSIYHKFFNPDLEVTLPPVDLGSLGTINEKSPTLQWRYFKCLADHLLDFSGFYPTRQWVQTWTFTRINLDEECQARLVVYTGQELDIWLNGERLLRSAEAQQPGWRKIKLPVPFLPGNNDLIIRCNAIGVRHTPLAFAVQIQDYPAERVEILLPTEIEEDLIERRMILEDVVDHATLDRYVFGYLTGDLYDKNEPITLRFTSDLESRGEITHRLQSLKGDIFQAGIKNCEAGSEFTLARLFPLRNGPHHLALMPIEAEYYQKKIQFERKDPFWVVRTRFSLQPYGTLASRAKEALQDAAKRRNESIFVEIAKFALEDWEKIKPQYIASSIQRIQGHEEGSVLDLLGLLYLLRKYRKKHKISDELISAGEKAILTFPYLPPGNDLEQMDYQSENRQILFYAVEILAGQLFPQTIFAASSQAGNWHQNHGEEGATAWMQLVGQYGFREWDSPILIENTLTALSMLVDLADSQPVRELASVLMDKILFSLAINSWKGMLGSSQGTNETAGVLSHRLEATSGICRLMWGTGNFNENVMGTVSLACCRKYALPGPILQIASDQPAAFWSRERAARRREDVEIHNVEEDQNDKEDPLTFSWEVNKVVYKTDDYMLASAQDYYPGKPGNREHVWQATMGPDCVVFVNHPGNLSENDANVPNLWLGNKTLPQVAQWGDLLICLYLLPEDDWTGFTHAYFPASTFDEYELAGNWAFARKEKAYLALYAARGFEWVTSGKTALRELRSHGHDNLWICQMGQELLDGSFHQFKEKILAINLQISQLSVEFTSLRGDMVSFTWQKPMTINGQIQALSKLRHYENSYCIADIPARQIEIFYGEEGIRLSFQ